MKQKISTLPKTVNLLKKRKKLESFVFQATLKWHSSFICYEYNG